MQFCLVPVIIELKREFKVFFLNNTFILNNDDGKAIHIVFTSEALYREIDNLKDHKASGVDRASPFHLEANACLKKPKSFAKLCSVWTRNQCTEKKCLVF